MAGNRNQPQADLILVTEEARGDTTKDVWTPLCPAWETQGGGYTMELRTVPAGLLSGKPVRLVLKKRTG